MGGGMGLRWLSRFKLIRQRRISLATLPRYGWRDGWMGGRRDGWIGRQREKVRGVYGFSSLMKQK